MPEADRNAAAFREWLLENHGTDFGASDRHLAAELDWAHAYIRAGGRGGLYWVAARRLTQAQHREPGRVE